MKKLLIAVLVLIPAALSAQAVNNTLDQVEKLSISAVSGSDLSAVRTGAARPFTADLRPGGPGGSHGNPPPHVNPPGPVGGGHNNGGNNGNHNGGGHINPPPPHNGGGHNPPPPHNGGGHNGGVIIVNPPPPYHPGYNDPYHPGYHNPGYPYNPSYPPGYYGPGHHDTTPVYSGPVDAKVVWITVGVILAVVLLAILV